MGRRVTNRLTAEFLHSSYQIDPLTGCWRWSRYIQSFGYGQAEIDGRIWLAHRMAWKVTHGRLPRDLLVLHRCDNPPCVNPDHLFLGTHKDNSADAIAKGRFDPMGVSRHSAKKRIRKLTDDAVRDIRTARLRDRDFARLYTVSRTIVCDIRNRKVKTLIPD